MVLESTLDYPLISVIIPCYNQGEYLATAIESILAQSYPCKEIVVVDDGSIDNTKEVAQRFAEVRYVYQSNKGLPSARNTGISNSKGKYLVFLDADDWLLSYALQVNWSYLKNDPQLAFVSGGYKLIYVPENKEWDVTREVAADHYLHLLQGNYIGMHASVMFHRWALEKQCYDVTLKACEDYELYLRLAREHPVLHHTNLMAVYRIHTENMSGNYILMLKTAMEVLQRQKSKLRSKQEEMAFSAGFIHFKQYYTLKIYDRLLHNIELDQENSSKEQLALMRYNLSLFIKYLTERRKLRRGKGQLLYQRLAARLRALIK